MKPLTISAPASEELGEAVRWYEERRPGWGVRLFDAVVHTIDLIMAHEEIGVARRGKFPSRQLRVLGFPYLVAYRIREHGPCSLESRLAARVNQNTLFDNCSIFCPDGNGIPDSSRNSSSLVRRVARSSRSPRH